ncbi:MAG: glycosyltransferase family 4 protein [Candidatus Eisenbacteria bacterium]
MFRPRSPVGFLPNLVHVPDRIEEKPPTPTFAFMGRLEGRKRPERFLELAPRFPECRFAVVGKADSQRRDRRLRERYGAPPNAEWIGYVDEFRDRGKMEAILSRSWALVNTSSREGLPISFLEAAAHGCAVVSAVDPDEFATRFGVRVAENDFAGALGTVLHDPAAAFEAARKVRRYVAEVYEWEKAIDAHLECYRRHLDGADGSSLNRPEGGSP